MVGYWRAAYVKIIPLPDEVKWEVLEYILSLNNLLSPEVWSCTLGTSRIPSIRKFFDRIGEDDATQQVILTNFVHVRSHYIIIRWMCNFYLNHVQSLFIILYWFFHFLNGSFIFLSVYIWVYIFFNHRFWLFLINY